MKDLTLWIARKNLNNFLISILNNQFQTIVTKSSNKTTVMLSNIYDKIKIRNNKDAAIDYVIFNYNSNENTQLNNINNALINLIDSNYCFKSEQQKKIYDLVIDLYFYNKDTDFRFMQCAQSYIQ